MLIEQWRNYYNTIWPHSSLGYRRPVGAATITWLHTLRYGSAKGNLRSLNTEHGPSQRMSLSVGVD